MRLDHYYILKYTESELPQCVYKVRVIIRAAVMALMSVVDIHLFATNMF